MQPNSTAEVPAHAFTVIYNTIARFPEFHECNYVTIRTNSDQNIPLWLNLKIFPKFFFAIIAHAISGADTPLQSRLAARRAKPSHSAYSGPKNERKSKSQTKD